MSEEKVVQVNHILYIDGSIDAYTASEFLESVNQLEREYGAPDFLLKINSPGGNLDACKTICCTIEQYSGKIVGSATENCSSGAFVILQKCDLRIMYENTKVTIHEASMYSIPECRMTAGNLKKLNSGGNGNLHRKVDEIVEGLNEENKRMANLFVERSGHPLKEIRKIMSNENQSKPSMLKEIGLLDEIYTAY